MSKTAVSVVRRSTRLVEMKGARKRRLEEEVCSLEKTGEGDVREVRLRKITSGGDLIKEVRVSRRGKGANKDSRKEKIMRVEEKRKRSSTREEEDVGLPAKKAAAMKVKVNQRKKSKKEKWSCEWNLPYLALEKVFSYLDWKDLERAMLVCRRWHEVGGHPSLWARFPLQLSCQRLNSVPNIYRLGWINSLTISLSGETESLVSLIQAAIESLPRLEELFIFYHFYDFFFFNDPKAFILNTLKADNNKLVRVGTSLSYFNSSEPDYLYYVSNCDAGANTFLKKTHLEKDKNNRVSIYGVPGLHLTNEILETVCTISSKPVDLATNLIIDQKMDLRKLANAVDFLDLDMLPEDWEEQEVTPLNAILDLQDGNDNGVFGALAVPKNLLLKSKWVERLGGRAKLETSIGNVIYTVHTRTGLQIVDPKVA